MPVPELPPGDPLSLGGCVVPGGLRFGVWAPEAEQVWLCLFDDNGQQETQRLPLLPSPLGVWHGTLPGGRAGQVYGYRAAGRWAPEEGLRFNPQRLLLDPYAREMVGSYRGRTQAELAAYLDFDPADPSRPHPDDNAAVALKARVLPELAAQPVALKPPPAGQRVIAEVHVRGASALHPGLQAGQRGSYAGLAHPTLIAHWRGLGVTTVQLMPVQARADEARLQLLGLRNHWGYTPIGLLAPEARYAGPPELETGDSGHTAGPALREAIAKLRSEGFEVLLDVVFNHSAETDLQGPCLGFKGLANRHWYRAEPDAPGQYQNWTGCGNTLNLAEPMVLRWVVDALRHWVQAYGVDGFRYDLAPILARDDTGRFAGGAALFAALQADPLLRRCLHIAEPWDLAPHSYQLGGFPPGWLEWNDQARDSLRAYWLQPGHERSTRAALATRLAGSSDRFAADPRRPRPPSASVNFVTSHDGFTLRDLVSYNQRHNEANGEHNRDGHGDNLSWNAGIEGDSDDPAVQHTRARLQRALLATLLLSRGTPMLLMGDELGHTQHGNNNAYCQDNPVSWLDWGDAGKPAETQALPAFIARLTALRRADAALHADQWLSGQPGADGVADVTWATPSGAALDEAGWHDRGDRALSVLLAPPGLGHCTLLLFNPMSESRRFVLAVPPRGGAWRPLLDSATPSGEPAKPEAAAGAPDGLSACELPPRSVQVWCSAALALTPLVNPAAQVAFDGTNGD